MEDNKKIYDLYNEVIKIDKEKLVSYLKCEICKGIFRTPMTINECMHTFCKTCIFRHFYSNITTDYCPTCKISLGGKPLDTLIFDNSIASLIEILFPEFDAIDKENCVILFFILEKNVSSVPR